MSTSAGAESGTQARIDDRLWPFGRSVAMYSVPAIFITLLISLGILRAAVDLPTDDTNFAWVLLGVALLSLIPVLLVLVEAIADRGGKLSFRGITVDFSLAAIALPSAVTIPANVGAPYVPIPDSGSHEILDALRKAAANDVAVVDLEDGEAWWETRLLVLCAGAARQERPDIIVFVATVGNERRRFQGWSEPSPLLRRLLTTDLRYEQSFRRATVAASQWALADPPDEGKPTAQIPLTPASRLAGQHSSVAYSCTSRWNEHTLEQYLAMDLGETVEQTGSRGISVVRLNELFAPVLRTNALDQSQSNEAQQAALFGAEDRSIAITKRGTYVGIVPRLNLLSGLLRQLIEPRGG